MSACEIEPDRIQSDNPLRERIPAKVRQYIRRGRIYCYRRFYSAFIINKIRG